jgi:outer membrane protein W
MTPLRRFAVVMFAAALLSPARAWAQTDPFDQPEEFRGRLFVHFEGQAVKAKQSFEAVTGSSMMPGFGAGLEVQNVWKGLFVRAAISKLSKSGERVFVDEGEIFPLGIPIDITMTPIEVAAGWRFKPFGGRIVPYAGLGPVFLKHREESEDDDDDDSVNETFGGIALFAGIEVPVASIVSAGAEIGLRKVTVDSPGGAMRGFGENDLGGVTFRVMISFRSR